MTIGDTDTRVLVVDDEPLYAQQLEAILLDLNYQVVGPVHNANDALVLYRDPTMAPDVALLDIDLGPRSANGIELARQLVAERPLPLIFLSSLRDASAFALARQVGPAAYLTKPVEPGALQRAIELAVDNFSREPDESESTNEAAPLTFAHADTQLKLPEAVFVKVDGLLVKVRFNDLLWLEAVAGGCQLFLAGGQALQVRQGLGELARHLPPNRFFQIHRSYVVNADSIERLDPARDIVQVSGQLLPLGRLYRTDLLRRLRLA